MMIIMNDNKITIGFKNDDDDDDDMLMLMMMMTVTATEIQR